MADAEGPGMTPEATPRAPLEARRSWGPWATIGWTALIAATMLGFQVAAQVGFAVALLARDPRASIAALAEDGTVLAVATLASTPAVLALVAILARVRLAVGDYLALRRFSARRSTLAVLGMGALLAASAALTRALGRPPVSPATVDVYRSAWLPALLVARLICAPLGDEALFRGFFYRGIADSRWGPGLAIGFSAIAWSLFQVEQDLYGYATVYLIGLYLGAIRHWTGSLPTTILLHILANAVATAEAAMIAGRGG